ncbi:ROK family glucokinase [Phytohabitans flavus]|uniref:Glucokinase n=1 Tax=Phytohabitans flavus TaxID=1076124 RepID=A0A6F8XS07_9ACTN|nr:ROK family protein [Phytohabitans flavus]BCB76632.1 glucokinase [Phytohabitans flavus]
MSASGPGLLVAVDIGGTKTALAVAAPDPGGPEPYLARHRFPTPPTAGGVLDALLPAAHRLVAGRPVSGIGVSFGGHVSLDTPPALRSLHVPGWEQVPLATEMERALGAPVLVANDAEAAARGEHACIPPGQREIDLAYLTISTGVGGALLLRGRPHRGRNGLAGEVGHIRLRDTGACSCGGQGHLEAFASGPAIARAAAEAVRRDPTDPTALRARLDRDGALTARDVDAAARGGDPLAAAVLAEAGELVGQASAMIGLLLDPDVILVGGGVSQSGDAFWEPLRAAVRADVLRHVLVRPALLGPDSALRGALELAADAARGAGELRQPAAVAP